MKTPNAFALFILAISFLNVQSQEKYEYPYISAASEHEQFILAIENGLYNSDVKRPGVKSVRIPNGITLEYAEQVNLNGKPVVLLHGFPNSGCSYDLVFPHLPASMRALFLSLRGYDTYWKDPERVIIDLTNFVQSVRIK